MAESKSCNIRCLPGRSSSTQKQPYLSFHSFPVDPNLKLKWIQVIQREEGNKFTIKRGSTYVCSRLLCNKDGGWKQVTEQVRQPGSSNPSKIRKTTWNPHVWVVFSSLQERDLSTGMIISCHFWGFWIFLVEGRVWWQAAVFVNIPATLDYLGLFCLPKYCLNQLKTWLQRN